MVEKTQNQAGWPALFDPFRTFGGRLADWLNPASDAKSDEKGYTITLELPGVAEDEVELTIDDGAVTVSGEKQTTREDKGETWYFSERQYGSFSRTFRLPTDADPDSARAELKDGVLTVTVARKAPAASTARKVKVAKG
ncbi:MAG: Hsp20 family protein [Limimaricola sp.]|uniref:Hsp20/alpha crystallin family protein n=1 Tax=Limimaricola sp. TaxID=2211665 RepID=UPI001DEE43AC|nr:Hsp20/alpha crystallin family protein [Limimaricola sp.]MBI1416293.1 Hsp20 family protein [Limimaricola sp.]